ncbi:hypothetical protein [Jeotgalibaca porci]|uniref:hypothetical protein n=1 Tax=Jeotgalibaca porci TaxID=1868793 RepID=UPI00359FA30B
MLTTATGQCVFRENSKAEEKSKLSIQFLLKYNHGAGDYYAVYDSDSLPPQDGDYVINKTDNVLVQDNDELGRLRTFKSLDIAEAFCASYGGTILWVRGRPFYADGYSKLFVKLDDIPDADQKDVDAFFGEMTQGVNRDAVELADSEFVNLLETLTHKKLSEAHKSILFKVLNSNI